MGTDAAQKPSEPYWLVYIALLLGGLILLGNTFHITQLTKWTSIVGIAMVYSAFALFVGKGRTPGWLAAALISTTTLLVLILR